MFMEKMNLRELENRIEFLRNEMIMIGLKEGLSSEKTISISQKLDYYIAKYHTMHKKPDPIVSPVYCKDMKGVK